MTTKTKESKPAVVINELTGTTRWLVKGKGWMDKKDIAKDDLVKSMNGEWVSLPAG